jgi:hypothetical protein
VASAGGQRPNCQCTIDRLQQTLPFAEFKTADAAIRHGEEIPEKTKGTIDAATEGCRE